ncbi:hypothetical protein HK405_002141 [Cladochytrium tenue]|nr:hypothetical protein HK405_002141 [Cladochytrium tenue]
MVQKDELLQWSDGCDAFAAGDYQTAIAVFEPIADTSRIHFNMGMAFSNLSQREEAIQSFSLAVKCDSYLAIAYFQRGTLFYKQDLIAEAIADFNDALTYLRNNLLIDYTQLGLPHKLFSAEISYNRGLCFAAMNMEEAAVADFDDAMRTRPLEEALKPRYARIEEALDLGARAPSYCPPFEVPPTMMFKPPEAKLKNIKKKEYIGKSYVVASVDSSDDFAGFSGTLVKCHGEVIALGDQRAAEPVAAATKMTNETVTGLLGAMRAGPGPVQTRAVAGRGDQGTSRLGLTNRVMTAGTLDGTTDATTDVNGTTGAMIDGTTGAMIDEATVATMTRRVEPAKM